MAEVKFSNPPLTEIVCGVAFDAPEFSSVHFGVYWDRVRQRFPIPTDQPPLATSGMVGFSLFPPLRRVWFESSDKKDLVQLQSDRFYYNWRKQTQKDDYPQFKQNIYPRFTKEWNEFYQWCTGEIGLLFFPTQYELTYINQIDKSSGWGNPADHQKVFTFEGRDWNGFLSCPESHVFALQFLLPDNSGTLSVSGKQVSVNADEKPVMLLELTARSLDSDYEIDAWFNLAHNYIVNGFVDLTKSSMHKEWGLLYD